MIDAYAHLVGTVEPYLPLFVEPALFGWLAHNVSKFSQGLTTL